MTKRAILETANHDVDAMHHQHAELDRRVRELDRRAFLTPAEQHELAQLKKQKLVLKDRIRDSSIPPEPLN